MQPPPYAYRSLEADLDVGLLLPCNVIVYETDDRKAYVAAINPISALEVIQSEELRSIAAERKQRGHPLKGDPVLLLAKANKQELDDA